MRLRTTLKQGRSWQSRSLEKGTKRLLSIAFRRNWLPLSMLVETYSRPDLTGTSWSVPIGKKIAKHECISTQNWNICDENQLSKKIAKHECISTQSWNICDENQLSRITIFFILNNLNLRVNTFNLMAPTLLAHITEEQSHPLATDDITTQKDSFDVSDLTRPSMLVSLAEALVTLSHVGTFFQMGPDEDSLNRARLPKPPPQRSHNRKMSIKMSSPNKRGAWQHNCEVCCQPLPSEKITPY